MNRPGLPSPAGALHDPTAVRYDPAGSCPSSCRTRDDGRVLMLAWTNAEALAATLATGDVHFFSRSRGALWRKGETSGHVLRLVDLALDCDGDALLARVDPRRADLPPRRAELLRPRRDRGCDRARRRDGSRGRPEAGAEPGQGFAWLETLWSTIADRAARRPAGSYTARLLAAGVDGPARKVAEEATEVLMAAKDDAALEAAGADRAATRAALAGEAADLLYHALVLLAERGLPPAAVLEQLRARHGG